MDNYQQADIDIKGRSYDVFVVLPAGAQLAVIRAKALQDGIIPAGKIEKLVEVLEKAPKVKIGTKVTPEVAEKAKKDFSQAGLDVHLIPVLSLEEVTRPEQDDRVVCPACEKNIKLTEERQCPSCGVFVDKFSDEFMLRKRLLEKERERLEAQRVSEIKASEKRQRDALEAALREEIRKELAAEYGLEAKPGAFGRFDGLVKVGGVLLLVGAAFGAGHWTAGPSDTAAMAVAPKKPPGPDVDKSFEKLGAPTTGSAAEAAGPDAGLLAPGDSLVAGVAQGRSSGKALTVEQAVAASQTLAASIGVKTGQGAGGGNQPGSASAQGSASVARGGAGVEPAPLPAQHKLALGVEFARTLAEMGQIPRAREVVKSLRAAPGVAVDTELAATVNQADLEVRAWGVAFEPVARRRQSVDALRADAGAITDPAARTLALARIGAILAESPGMPAEVSLAFLKLAREALGNVAEPDRLNAVSGEFLVALGRSLLAATLTKAGEGSWARVQALSAEIGALAPKAADTQIAIRLISLDLRGKSAAGLGAEIPARLGTALELIEKEASLATRASLLRMLAAAPEVVQDEKFKAAVERLDSAAETKLGAARAQALTGIALMYADLGVAEKFLAYSKRVQESQGPASAQLSMAHADLIVGGDIAAARQFHSVRAYAQAETRIRTVAGYLL